VPSCSYPRPKVSVCFTGSVPWFVVVVVVVPCLSARLGINSIVDLACLSAQLVVGGVTGHKKLVKRLGQLSISSSRGAKKDLL